MSALPKLAEAFILGSKPGQALVCKFCGATFGPVERFDAFQHVVLWCSAAPIAARQTVHDASQSLVYPAWQHYTFPAQGTFATCRFCDAVITSRSTRRLCAHLMYMCSTISGAVRTAVIDAGIGTDSPYSSRVFRAFVDKAPGAMLCRFCDAEVRVNPAVGTSEFDVAELELAAEVHLYKDCPKCPHDLQEHVGRSPVHASLPAPVQGVGTDACPMVSADAVQRDHYTRLLSNCFQDLGGGNSRCFFCHCVRTGALACLKRHLLACRKAPDAVTEWLDRHTLLASVRRGPRRQHPVWHYFREVGFLRAECMFCLQEVRGDVQAKCRHLNRCDEASADSLDAIASHTPARRSSKASLDRESVGSMSDTNVEAGSTPPSPRDVSRTRVSKRRRECDEGLVPSRDKRSRGRTSPTTKQDTPPKSNLEACGAQLRSDELASEWPLILRQLRAQGARLAQEAVIEVPAACSTARHHLPPPDMRASSHAWPVAPTSFISL